MTTPALTTSPARAWVDQARAHADAATPGPWRVGAEGSEGSRVNPDTGDKREDARYVVAANGRTQPQDGHNARFVAAARTDVPRLAAALAAVLDLHHGPRTSRHGSGCVQCGLVWPCPTVQAITDAVCGAQ